MRSRYTIVGCLAGLGIVLSASHATAETIRIAVDKLAFIPAHISAHVGDTIEWVNADFVAHTATTRPQQWDVMIAAKKTGRVTLKKAGVFDYYCRFHPNMTGRITVAD
jgi:plastocyanin